MQSLCYAVFTLFLFIFHNSQRARLWLVQIFNSVLQALPRVAETACVYMVEGCPTSKLYLFHIKLYLFIHSTERKKN